MTIKLRPEQEQIIAQAMATGAYGHPDEVVARALELLQTDDQWLQGQKSLINEKIERAFAQLERGEFYTPDESRADMERRKVAWRAQRNAG